MAKFKSDSKLFNSLQSESAQGLGGIGFSPDEAKKMVKALYEQNETDFLNSKNSITENGIVEVSFDEKQVKRILNFPGCKGVRCYLALTDKIFNPKTNKCETTRGKYRITIVMVGIDENGVDLLIEFDNNKSYIANCECGGHCDDCNTKIDIKSFIKNNSIGGSGNKLLLLK